MHKVNVDELFAGKQSKYALVVGVAKRAREITAELEKAVRLQTTSLFSLLLMKSKITK